MSSRDFGGGPVYHGESDLVGGVGESEAEEQTRDRKSRIEFTVKELLWRGVGTVRSRVVYVRTSGVQERGIPRGASTTKRDQTR